MRAETGVDEAFCSNIAVVSNGQNWLTTFVKVEFEDTDELRVENCLREAWKQVVQENPSINSTYFPHVQYPDNPRVEVTLLDTQEKLDAWASKSFVVDDTTEKAEEYLQPKYSNNEYFSLIWVKKSGEIALHGAHAINDTYGSLLTLNRVFELYGKADPAVQSTETLASRLAKTSQTRLRCKPIKYNSMAECLEDEFLGSEIPVVLEEAGKAGGLPSTKNADRPELGATGGSHTITVDFTEQETKQVIANAKKHGAKVGQFLWAASATALAKFPENEGKTFTTLSINSLRDVLDEEDICAGMHIFAWPIAIPITPSLQTNVDWVRTYMEKYLPLFKNVDKYNHPEFDKACGMWELFCESLLEILAGGVKPFYSQIVSSVGVVDKFIKPSYEKVTVTRVNVCCCQASPGAHNLWHTFNGRLMATYCYSDAFHNPRDMEDNAQTVKRILLST